MLICHCYAVCDRMIRNCIRAGARSPDDVGASCGAGTACGGCRPAIETILECPSDTDEDQGVLRLRRIEPKAA